MPNTLFRAQSIEERSRSLGRHLYLRHVLVRDRTSRKITLVQQHLLQLTNYQAALTPTPE